MHHHVYFYIFPGYFLTCIKCDVEQPFDSEPRNDVGPNVYKAL